MDVHWWAFVGVVVLAYLVPGPDMAVVLRSATRASAPVWPRRSAGWAADWSSAADGVGLRPAAVFSPAVECTAGSFRALRVRSGRHCWR